MTKVIFILIFFLQIYQLKISFSQEDKLAKYDTINVVEIIDPIEFLYPEFPGGDDSLKSFLKENLKFPNKEWCGSGTVYVQFTVDVDGTIKDYEIVRGLVDFLDKEALRVISLMPKWKPALDKENNPVKTQMRLPIKFRID